jgi:CO dehydrogenase nickel-insertion accessory protein CooC1
VSYYLLKMGVFAFCTKGCYCYTKNFNAISEETFEFSPARVLMPNGVMQINKIERTRLVLAPLNRVQVNTLLDQLPEGAQLTQEVHAILDSLEDVVDLGIRGEATNTETDTAVGALVAASKGT